MNKNKKTQHELVKLRAEISDHLPWLHRQDYETLKKFEIAPESYQFADLVSAIHFYCHDVGYYFSEENSFSEEKFRDDIKKTYLKIQYYL